MTPDGELLADSPFSEFRVETEPMPDGRSIHYYEWPADQDAEAADAPAGDGGSPPAEANPT